MLDEFIIKELVAKKPFFMKNKLNNIFSWGELENLLNLRPFVNINRFTVLSDKTFRWAKQAWMSDVDSFSPTVLDYAINKYVCYFNDCSRVNEKINNICYDIENTLNYPTDAHIYFAANDECQQGFPPHWDWSHNLIVQVEGTTQFLLWDVVATGDEERTTEKIDKEPIFDVTMEPGDIIFVPAKYWHQAISLTKRLSISFPSNPNENSEPQERYWLRLKV